MFYLNIYYIYAVWNPLIKLLMGLLTCQYETHACLNMFIIKHVVPLYQCTFGIYIRNRPASVLHYNIQGFWRAIFTWGLASIHLLDLLQRAGCKIIPICIYSMDYVLVESFVLHYVSTNHSEQIQRTFFSWKKETWKHAAIFSTFLCVFVYECVHFFNQNVCWFFFKKHYKLTVENLL